MVKKGFGIILYCMRKEVSHSESREYVLNPKPNKGVKNYEKQKNDGSLFNTKGNPRA